MKILFIGGTGIISSACSQLAIACGYDLTLLNRGQSHRPVPAGAKQIQADIRNPAAAKAALADHHFDVVVNWIAFTPEHIETDLALFNGRIGQYIFISSASAYQTPPAHLPITESTPLHNPFWAYSRQKIACEGRLIRAYRETDFPVTMVRPSHTYDQTLLPMRGGYTVVNRMRQGKKVIVHGDGTSLWTLTHHRDFAVGFVGLLGHPAAIGSAFHITSDESLSWNQIFQQVAAAAGAEAQIVHTPSATLARHDAAWGDSLLGDKAHSMVFDNSKIKRLVPEFVAKIPFWQGAQETMAWHDADPARQAIDPNFDQLLDTLIARYDPTIN
ncbi:NAD-dependent epimerase/dehydratase family protein [Candidatus Leptofilum sp.]|uniref:NAD-dependent epimerase/dehydratase family protein n=1 Tax=Candidatus Leptofilum sp. TaxID=3241576 RepID=UPI003B5A7CB5